MALTRIRGASERLYRVAHRVADLDHLPVGGQPHVEFGTLLPYSQFGNKIEYEAGMGVFLEKWILFPRFLYRSNLLGLFHDLYQSLFP